MIKNWLRRARPTESISAQPSPSDGAIGFAELFGSIKPAGGAETQDVLFIGNCIAEGVQQGMSSIAGLPGFRFTAMPLHLRAMNHSESLHKIASAGHIFVQQLGAIDWSLLRETKQPTARETQLPDFVFRSPWPFDGEGGFGDPAAVASPHAKIRHQDGTLGRLRALEPEKKKRIQRYSDLDFEWARMIDRTIEAQAKFLAALDENSDTGVGAYILQNFQSEQLFYSSTHPSAAVFQFLCQYAWDRLDLPSDLRSGRPKFSGIDGWRDWSVPVHPLIAKRLGMRWIDAVNPIPLLFTR